MKKNYQKRIIFRATEELWLAIAQESLNRLITRQAFITQAIEEYIKKSKKSGD